MLFSKKVDVNRELSPKLIKMIDAAIKDGVITEKENQAIRQRALKEGYNMSRFDVLLDRYLFDRRSQKRVDTESLMLNNAENIDEDTSLTSSQKLSFKLKKLEDKWIRTIDDEFFESKKRKLEERKDKDIKDFIKLFPVPTEKDDLYDFINAIADKRHGNHENEYQEKFNESIKKAKALYGNDPQFKPLIERYTKFTWENLSSDQRIPIILVLGAILTLLLYYFFL